MPVGFEVMLKGVGDRGAVPVLALGRTLLVCVSTHTAPCHPEGTMQPLSVGTRPSGGASPRTEPSPQTLLLLHIALIPPASATR